MGIVTKRVHEPASNTDGYRVLIDRLWPRGLKKEWLRLDLWAKELAPSTVLRQWFGHDPARWDEFRRRYVLELDALADHWQSLSERAARHRVTLIYGAHDEQQNNAVALKEYLDGRRPTHGPG